MEGGGSEHTQAAGSRLRLQLLWVPGHTDGATGELVVQDLCNSLRSGLERADWPLLCGPRTLFGDDVVATLCSCATV